MDGIWRVEVLGAEGWEPESVALLQDGRYFDGAAHEYSVARYQVSGDEVRIDGTMVLFEGAQTVFGRRAGSLDLTFKGKLKDGVLTGDAVAGEFTARYRFTRLADLP